MVPDPEQQVAEPAARRTRRLKGRSPTLELAVTSSRELTRKSPQGQAGGSFC
jgi:hypothetical protein